MRATDFGSGSGGYKFGGLQDSGGYKFGGLQDCEPPILGLPAHEPVRGATRFGGLQDYALRILGPPTHQRVLEKL